MIPSDGSYSVYAQKALQDLYVTIQILGDNQRPRLAKVRIAAIYLSAGAMDCLTGLLATKTSSYSPSGLV
jgi:hypothetical protein